MFYGVKQPRPIPRGGAPALPNFGTPTNAHAVLPRMTEVGMVNMSGEGLVFRGSAMPLHVSQMCCAVCQ